MKKSLFARSCSPVALLNSHERRAGQSKRESIQGVWQAVEVTITGPGARTITIPEPRPNLTIITARHYSRVEDPSEEPRPMSGGCDEGERRRVAGRVGPFVGEAGTYEVTSGNLHHDAADRREEPGGDGVRSVHYLFVQARRRHDVGDVQNETRTVPSPIQSPSKPCASNDMRVGGECMTAHSTRRRS